MGKRSIGKIQVGIIGDLLNEFEDCKFEGPPPVGFRAWSDWAITKPKKGVVIRSRETKETNPLTFEVE